jgi:hypothetical protein
MTAGISVQSSGSKFVVSVDGVQAPKIKDSDEAHNAITARCRELVAALTTLSAGQYTAHWGGGHRREDGTNAVWVEIRPKEPGSQRLLFEVEVHQDRSLTQSLANAIHDQLIGGLPMTPAQRGDPGTADVVQTVLAAGRAGADLGFRAEEPKVPFPVQFRQEVQEAYSKGDRAGALRRFEELLEEDPTAVFRELTDIRVTFTNSQLIKMAISAGALKGMEPEELSKMLPGVLRSVCFQGESNRAVYILDEMVAAGARMDPLKMGLSDDQPALVQRALAEAGEKVPHPKEELNDREAVENYVDRLLLADQAIYGGFSPHIKRGEEFRPEHDLWAHHGEEG